MFATREGEVWIWCLGVWVSRVMGFLVWVLRGIMGFGSLEVWILRVMGFLVWAFKGGGSLEVWVSRVKGFQLRYFDLGLGSKIDDYGVRIKGFRPFYYENLGLLGLGVIGFLFFR